MVSDGRISVDRPGNPAIPDSLGALLAEEWTINVRSTLPSFLERMMMEEARKSGWETLKSMFRVLEDRINRMEIPRELHVTNGSIEEARRLYHKILRQWPIMILKALSQNVIKPFGPEIRFLLVYALERGSLMRSNASITEALYGGKRVKLGSANGSNENERSLLPIQKQDRVRLALFLALGPYLEERSKELSPHFIKPSGNENTSSHMSLKSRLQKILRVVWPLLRMTVKGTFLLHRWRYLVGRSVFFDPYSSLLNLVVRRTTMEDQHQIDKAPRGIDGENADTNVARNASIQKGTVELVKSSPIRWAAAGFTSSFILLAWLARIRSIRQDLRQERELQDLRESQQQEQERNRLQQEEISSNTDIDTPIFKKDSLHVLMPSPPQPQLPSQKGASFSFKESSNQDGRNSGLCPICNEPRIHPTASTGGYVFCLKCILESLRQNGAVCPVSRKPCPESSLVRLYEPTHHTEVSRRL